MRSGRSEQALACLSGEYLSAVKSTILGWSVLCPGWRIFGLRGQNVNYPYFSFVKDIVMLSRNVTLAFDNVAFPMQFAKGFDSHRVQGLLRSSVCSMLVRRKERSKLPSYGI
jgi:hypothetical protein